MAKVEQVRKKRKNNSTWTFVFWLILGGCVSISFVFLACIVLIISLFGIGMATDAFKLAYYLMSGMDQKIEPNFEAAKVKNIIWIILVGWFLYLFHKMMFGICWITYIGRPLAKMWNDTAKLVLMPFGVDIVY